MGIYRRARTILVGSSLGEILLLILLTSAVAALLAFGSNIKGLGYDNCRACVGFPEGEYLILNPVFFLPFVLGNHYTGFQIGTRMTPTIADFFARHADLYAWTIVWWFLLAYLIARVSSAGVFQLVRLARA